MGDAINLAKIGGSSMPEPLKITAAQEQAREEHGNPLPGWTRYFLQMGDLCVIMEAKDRITSTPEGARIFSEQLLRKMLKAIEKVGGVSHV